uniref:Uncharacterized protein n=1 Tax=Trichuris muris TaxID=70415 RepID=A0A5S6R4K8_TRIMR
MVRRPWRALRVESSRSVREISPVVHKWRNCPPDCRSRQPSTYDDGSNGEGASLPTPPIQSRATNQRPPSLASVAPNSDELRGESSSETIQPQ